MASEYERYLQAMGIINPINNPMNATPGPGATPVGPPNYDQDGLGPVGAPTPTSAGPQPVGTAAAIPMTTIVMQQLAQAERERIARIFSIKQRPYDYIQGLFGGK